MLSERMRQRLASAHSLGVARLDGYAWCCNKLGRDGTAKANLVEQADACVYGVLYRIDPGDWQRLDGFEPDYRRIAVEVGRREKMEAAFTYMSGLLTGRAAGKAYLDCMIRGAVEHGLPATHIERIVGIPVDSQSYRSGNI